MTINEIHTNGESIDELKQKFVEQNKIFTRFVDTKKKLRYDFVSLQKSSVRLLIYHDERELIATLYWCGLGKLITFMKNKEK